MLGGGQGEGAPLTSIYSVFPFFVGVEKKLDIINQLKVKGLVLGPLHTVQADQPNTLDLKEITPVQGTKEALAATLEKAHKKGVCSSHLTISPDISNNGRITHVFFFF